MMAKHENHPLKHMTTGDHMHIEQNEDGGYTTHSIHDGQMHGPEEHATMGALKKHIANCMPEDGECEM